MRKIFKIAALALCLAPLLGGCELTDKDRGWMDNAERISVYASGNDYSSNFSRGSCDELLYKTFLNSDNDYYWIDVKCVYENGNLVRHWHFVKCPYEIEYKEARYDGSLSQNQA